MPKFYLWPIAVLLAGLLAGGCIVSKQEYDAVQSQLIEKEQRVAKLTNELAAIGAKLEQQSNALAAANEQIASLEEKTSQYDATIAALEAKLKEGENAKKAETTKPDASMQQAQKTIESQQVKIDAFTRELQATRVELNAAKNEAAEAQKQVQSLNILLQNKSKPERKTTDTKKSSSTTDRDKDSSSKRIPPPVPPRPKAPVYDTK